MLTVQGMREHSKLLGLVDYGDWMETGLGVMQRAEFIEHSVKAGWELRYWLYLIDPTRYQWHIQNGSHGHEISQLEAAYFCAVAGIEWPTAKITAVRRSWKPKQPRTELQLVINPTTKTASLGGR
jgi:hypothetical protein